LRTIAVEKTDSDLRRVDVRITSTVREIQGPALTVRGGLLVQCVRAYLMAVDNELSTYISGAEVRSKLWD
ncbi:MAG: hypothetical protein ACRC1K_10090, partial [Planctomycetia bacterium]